MMRLLPNKTGKLGFIIFIYLDLINMQLYFLEIGMIAK